jgi:hypothetical protein
MPIDVHMVLIFLPLGRRFRRSPLSGAPWLAENPTEIIVVPDLEDTEVIALLEARAVTGRR